MMVAILTVSLFFLEFANQRYLRTLSEELVEKTRITLERDSEKLDDMMYATVTLPTEIEDSRFYWYLLGATGQIYEIKYYPVLSMIRGALQKQVVLISGADETLLYISSMGSLVGTRFYEPAAADYFEKHLALTDETKQLLLSSLAMRTRQVLLPVQTVQMDDARELDCLILVLQPLGSSISVVSFFSRETLLSRLGIDQMPKGTYYEILGPSGEVLDRSEGDIPSEADAYLLEGALKSLGMKVRVAIPRSYYRELLSQMRLWGILITSVVVVVGFLLAVFLSRAAVRPIERLIKRHGKSSVTRQKNEILYLDEVLNHSKEAEERFRDRLKLSLLTKAFYRDPLSEEDEKQLLEWIPYLNQEYYAAVFYGPQDLVASITQRHGQILQDSVAVALAPDEVGLLFPGAETELYVFMEFVHSFNAKQDRGEIRSGVSRSHRFIFDLDHAIREAFMAVPSEPGCFQ
ncbi:MAG: hypothetical protein J5794_03640, partial [Lachnospiraceae bacterium]|nr:hypothetical protein [Lachnospiraceae bacterium]